MKEFIKKNKMNFVIIICVICAGLTTVSAAVILFSSNEVSYDNATSGMSSNNVQDAIDELYGVARLSDRMDELEEELNTKVDIDTVYPVGSVYISINDDTASKVKNRFGGTWVSFGSGRTLVGVNTSDTSFNTVEKTGGGKTTSYTPAGSVGNTTLTIAQMPNHAHNVFVFNNNNTAHIAQAYNNSTNGYYNTGGAVRFSGNSPWVSGSTITTAGSNIGDFSGGTDKTGGGGAHNHGFTGTAANISTVQPYITVYMWKRTA